MKILALSFSVLLASTALYGQSTLSDTLPVTVDLTQFRPRKKIVKAEYGKVNIYFNQSDYLGEETKADTVKITPKYLNYTVTSRLLKKGKARVSRLSTDTFEDSIIHYLKQYGTMASRLFAFTDNVIFFNHTERYGIMDIYDLEWPDSVETQKADPKPFVREFEYPEEFADTKDRSAIRIKDYFPANISMYYEYDLNNGYDETDTIQCRKTKLGKEDVFYFADCYVEFRIVDIGTTMFGKGIYFYKHDSLFTVDVDCEKEIGEDKSLHPSLLLPATMLPGDSVVINGDWEERSVFTYLSRGDIKVKDSVYKDCIQIKILEYWPGTIYLGYVWLKKGVGLVKWMRSTGRVDELINRFTERTSPKNKFRQKNISSDE